MARDAKDNPISASKKEVSNTDLNWVEPRVVEEVDMADRTGDSIALVEGTIDKDYTEALAFAEEPVCINIQRPPGKRPEHVVPCWVNGKGAEVFANGKWVTLGFLPVGGPIVTRRKYVEVLAAAKIDTVENVHPTVEQIQSGDMGQNKAVITTTPKYAFSVIQDTSKKGAAWFNNLMYARA